MAVKRSEENLDSVKCSECLYKHICDRKFSIEFEDGTPPLSFNAISCSEGQAEEAPKKSAG